MASTNNSNKKTTGNTVAKNNKDEELQALRDQVSMLTETVRTLLAAQQNNISVPVNNNNNSLNREVKIVHLVERAPGLSSVIQLSNMRLEFHSFGEVRTLDQRQAEELAGSKREWFEQGILAFGAGSEDIAERFSLKSISDYKYITKDFMNSLGNLSVNELEELYNRLCEGHKQFIIEYFKRMIIDGKDPRYSDPQKIEMLNRVTIDPITGRGAMSGVLLDRERMIMNNAADATKKN